MENCVEKIYCCDRGDNDNALAAAILANKGHDSSNMWPLAMMNNMNNPALTAMMANGGMNGMWNNPFVYLVWMMFAGRFFNNGNGWSDGNGNGAAQNIEVQNQLQAIRSQMQDNQNSNLLMDAIKGNGCAIGQLASSLNCDFNALQGAICSVQSAIQQVAGQVGFSSERVINAVNMGDCNVIQALKDCCCTTQKSILEMGYQNQLQNCSQTNTIMTGINTVNTGLERGFAQTAYATQQQTCDIINNANANTQRIVDTLNTHWNEENQRQIQDLKFQLSQERQNNLLLSRLGGNCNCGNTCGCGCGCGCGQ